MITNMRKRTARSLIRLARRLDPPRDPYGEWDDQQGALVVKIPDGAGGAMSLANVKLGAGQIQSTARLAQGGIVNGTAGGPYCGVCGAPIDAVPVPAHPGDMARTYGSCPNGCDQPR